MERVASAALASGGGLLVALSLPPWGWWPLAFLGVALFEVALGPRAAPRRRALLGAVFAATWLSMGMGWMWFLTVPGYLVAVAAFAGGHALAAAVAPAGPWRVIARPAAHTLVEAVRLVVPFGGVPLATLAIGQAGGPLLGVARVGGVLLLTWLVFQVGVAGGALVTTVLGTGDRHGAHGRRDLTAPGRATRHAWAALAVGALVVLASAVAPSGADTGRALRVTVVQGGGPQGTHAIDTDPRLVLDRHLAATATIAPGTADLVLWPENVINVRTFAGSDVHDAIAREAARIGAPVAVGITESVAATPERPLGAFLNAQVVVDPDGRIVSRYEKVRRVPFGEYMPLRGLLTALGAPVEQVPRDAVAGDGPAVLDLVDAGAGGEAVRSATVISWEVFFGDRARSGVRGGGQLVLNPTNGSSYTGTILQSQQVASSRLRAVETGRWVVQAAPTGFSAFVTDDARVLQRTAVSERAVISEEVPLRSGHTWYVRTGDAPVQLALLAALAVAWWRSRQLQQDGDRPVVDERHLHLGAEPAGRHRGAEVAQ